MPKMTVSKEARKYAKDRGRLLVSFSFETPEGSEMNFEGTYDPDEVAAIGKILDDLFAITSDSRRALHSEGEE